ncbi:group II intron maturase-specific domain-containing protein [Crocosphaera watsonii]|uniref:group II intron maturase-specific domain-containing protein n=1 Tax=Crocosphaera watsonii TaxID=263511 RepID=UPI0006523EF9|nr:group II intron maturase-specific domain-containing protein [Crocosphaera watsonii]
MSVPKLRYIQGFRRSLFPLEVELSRSWFSIINIITSPHTLKSHQGSAPGFDFLGFNIRQYPVGKYHSQRGYKTLIKPSLDSQKTHYRRLKQTIDQHKARSQADLIAALNPIIKGWSNYFSSVCSKKIFNRLVQLGESNPPDFYRNFRD